MLNWFQILVSKDLDDKGDMFVGSGTSTIGVLAVGSNAKVLMADSGETLGVKWATIPGTGDMEKATYDVNEDGIVDVAAGVDDGTHAATAEEIEDAIDKEHTHARTDTQITDAVDIVLGSGTATEALRRVYIPSGEELFFDTDTGEVRTRVSAGSAGSNTLINQAFSFASNRLQTWA